MSVGVNDKAGKPTYWLETTQAYGAAHTVGPVNPVPPHCAKCTAVAPVGWDTADVELIECDAAEETLVGSDDDATLV